MRLDRGVARSGWRVPVAGRRSEDRARVGLAALVDFCAWGVLAQPVQTPSGLTTLSLPIPSVPSLRGAAFVTQAASFASAIGTLFLTNPDVVVLD